VEPRERCAGVLVVFESLQQQGRVLAPALPQTEICQPAKTRLTERAPIVEKIDGGSQLGLGLLPAVIRVPA
jgi:hypothetical protein